MIKKQKTCLILLLVVLVNSGCKRNVLPHSIGARDQIVVISSPEFVLDSLINVLEKVEYYPTAEEVYNVKKASWAEFERYKFWRNLILVGTLGSSYIREVLKEEASEKNEKEPQIFLGQDLWVRLQTVIVIAGATQDKTQKLVENAAKKIYEILREEETNRFKGVVYMNGYQRRETEKMNSFLGASFEIPLGYRLARAENNFMTYIRRDPDRLVTLLCQSSPIKNPIRFRDSLFLRYFKGDEIVMDSFYVTTERGEKRLVRLTALDTFNFKNKKAIRIKGVWKNEKIEGGPMGGPFVSYIFERSGKWYFLDGHVFAPGKKKWPFLEEVDIILNTFQEAE
ncbi:MAG: DUF4837 family protein [candidate division WOR-3 bacterium]